MNRAVRGCNFVGESVWRPAHNCSTTAPVQRLFPNQDFTQSVSGHVVWRVPSATPDTGTVPQCQGMPDHQWRTVFPDILPAVLRAPCANRQMVTSSSVLGLSIWPKSGGGGREGGGGGCHKG